MFSCRRIVRKTCVCAVALMMIAVSFGTLFTKVAAEDDRVVLAKYTNTDLWMFQRVYSGLEIIHQSTNLNDRAYLIFCANAWVSSRDYWTALGGKNDRSFDEYRNFNGGQALYYFTNKISDNYYVGTCLKDSVFSNIDFTQKFYSGHGENLPLIEPVCTTDMRWTDDSRVLRATVRFREGLNLSDKYIYTRRSSGNMETNSYGDSFLFLYINDCDDLDDDDKKQYFNYQTDACKIEIAATSYRDNWRVDRGNGARVKMTSKAYDDGDEMNPNNNSSFWIFQGERVVKGANILADGKYKILENTVASTLRTGTMTLLGTGVDILVPSTSTFVFAQNTSLDGTITCKGNLIVSEGATLYTYYNVGGTITCDGSPGQTNFAIHPGGGLEIQKKNVGSNLGTVTLKNCMMTVGGNLYFYNCAQKNDTSKKYLMLDNSIVLKESTGVTWSRFGATSDIEGCTTMKNNSQIINR